jgi:hypothetical protein
MMNVCPVCVGTRRYRGQNCYFCAGDGQVTEQRVDACILSLLITELPDPSPGEVLEREI